MFIGGRCTVGAILGLMWFQNLPFTKDMAPDCIHEIRFKDLFIATASKFLTLGEKGQLGFFKSIFSIFNMYVLSQHSNDLVCWAEALVSGPNNFLSKNKKLLN